MCWERYAGFKKTLGKRRKKSFVNLSNISPSVSDHYFAALVIVGAVGDLDRCQLVKTGGS